MKWTWNRWAILAAILLLSTVAGIVSQPRVEGVEGMQVAENDGLRLTCPESASAVSGEIVFITCSSETTGAITDGSNIRAKVDPHFHDAVSYGITSSNVEGSQYVFTERIRPMRSRTLQVRAWLFRSENEVEQSIDFHVQQHLIYYVGRSLFWLQVGMLGFGIVFSVVVLTIANLRRLIVPATRFGREFDSTKLIENLSLPWLYLFSRKRWESADVRVRRRNYLITDALWLSLVAQIVLMLVFHIVDTSILAGQNGNWIFPPQIVFVVSVPLYAGIALALLVVRWLYLVRPLDEFPEQPSALIDEDLSASKGLSRTPIVCLTLFALGSAPLIALFYEVL